MAVFIVAGLLEGCHRLMAIVNNRCCQKHEIFILNYLAKINLCCTSFEDPKTQLSNQEERYVKCFSYQYFFFYVTPVQLYTFEPHETVSLVDTVHV